ncbi:MAG: MarR family transcriptional regulator [Rhodospirillales bacterium]
MTTAAKSNRPSPDKRPNRQEDAVETYDTGDAEPIDIVEAGMQRWRSERPDIDCEGKAVVGRILRLEGVILRYVDAALKPFDLKYPAYAVLATLRVNGAPYEMTPGALTQCLLLSSGGTSNLLARLERQGYITRTNSRRDRRAVHVRLTDAGKTLADGAMEAHAKAEREIIADLSEGERDALGALLRRLILTREGPAES